MDRKTYYMSLSFDGVTPEQIQKIKSAVLDAIKDDVLSFNLYFDEPITLNNEEETN